MRTVLGHLCRVVRSEDPTAADDADLLRRYTTAQDESAFGQIVERHGPMVLGVCRRLLRHEQEAEDAFQATFLILARKAGLRAWRTSVAGWLHTAARRVCRRALVVQAQRARQERCAAARPRPEPVSEAAWDQLQALLDDELQRLPDKLRAPLLLCCLAGVKHAEAARRLGCSEGVLRGRLYRGRELLRAGLVRRGLTLAAPALAAVLPEGTVLAVVRPALAAATTRAVRSSAAGSGIAGLSPPAVLARGVLRAMVLEKVKWVACALFSVLIVGAGAAWGVRHSAENRTRADGLEERKETARDEPARAAPPGKSAKPAAEKGQDPGPWSFPDVGKEHPVYVSNIGVVMAVDAERRVVLARMERTRLNAPFAIDPDAKMVFGEPPGMRHTFSQKLSLADLRKGMVVDDVERSEDGRTFRSFACSWPTINGTVKAVDRTRRTLTIDKASLTGDKDVGVFRDQTTFAVAREAAVVVDGPNARPFLMDLDDVPVGTAVALVLQIDQSVRLATLYPTGDLQGVVRSVDGAKRIVRVALQGSGNAAELGLEVNNDAVIRLEGQTVAPGDLKQDMPVLLRLDADRRAVVGLWAMRPWLPSR
jgi:RNA polymerase sigma factor (sigma-70 family)